MNTYISILFALTATGKELYFNKVSSACMLIGLLAKKEVHEIKLKLMQIKIRICFE
jgi:hypothetical protein